MTEQEANAIKNEGSNDSIQTTKMQNENPEPSKEDNTNTSYTNGNDKVNNGGNNYNNYNNYNNRNSYHSNNYSRNYQQRNTGGRYNNPNKFNNGGLVSIPKMLTNKIIITTTTHLGPIDT